jgi:hypothetical protein
VPIEVKKKSGAQQRSESVFRVRVQLRERYYASVLSRATARAQTARVSRRVAALTVIRWQYALKCT